MTPQDFIRSYDGTAHFVMDGLLTVLLTWAGHGVRNLVKFLKKLNTMERRIDVHAEVIDQHSEAIEQVYGKPGTFRRLAHARRTEDVA